VFRITGELQRLEDGVIVICRSFGIPVCFDPADAVRPQGDGVEIGTQRSL